MKIIRIVNILELLDSDAALAHNELLNLQSIDRRAIDITAYAQILDRECALIRELNRLKRLKLHTTMRTAVVPGGAC